MSPTVAIRDLADHVDSQVTLRGWIANVRSSGKLSFLELRDGSGYVQVVANRGNLGESGIAQLEQVTQESAAVIVGTVAQHPKRPDQVEIQATDVEVLHQAVDYPITKKAHGPDFLMENRHLWLRSKRQWAVQRVRSTVIQSIYQFLFGEGFIKIDSPIITGVACEGTTTLFTLDYFDLGKAFLSQSGQMYLEAAIAAHGKVFDFGPVFRAEKSKTRKHLIEFWMMDAEMAFVEHAENLKLQESLICYMVGRVLEQNRGDLEILERDLTALEAISAPFPVITHGEAVRLLQARGSEITADIDLGAGDEALLAEEFDKPVFIERWPAAIKAFYMKPCPDDPNYVLAADLMAPEGFGEIIGGSQREDDHDALHALMQREGLPIEDLQWYLDVRKYGSVPHSGFGLGIERIVAWLTGVAHIRETIPFPRLLNRFRP